MLKPAMNWPHHIPSPGIIMCVRAEQDVFWSNTDTHGVMIAEVDENEANRGCNLMFADELRLCAIAAQHVSWIPTYVGGVGKRGVHAWF